MTTHSKFESCSECNESLEAVGTESAVLAACKEFRARHQHDRPPFAWICWHHDMGIRIEAIFADEIDALRFAIGSGYLKVAPVGTGEIGNLP